MNILLLDGLPYQYEGFPIYADFRNMIQLDLILQDEELSDMEKTYSALSQLYPEIPSDLSLAVRGLEWFFARGQESDPEKSPSKNAPKKGFDFEQDANIIYAAFYATYNISLSTIDFLHWWEFMALFEGLPETTLIQRIIYWRTADVSQMDKSERKQVQKMKALFALKEPNKQPMSVEEINRHSKEAIKKRFAEAQRLKAEKQ